MKIRAIIIGALLLGAHPGAWGQGPFCGGVGTPGCNAIRYDSSIVAAWATGCVVERGPVDIVNPDGPRARYGSDSMGIGPASTSTTAAVSLGDGGVATLTFDQPIRNVQGPDFAVFENPFNDTFLELAFVEVSSDGQRFVRFPSTSLTPVATQVGTNGSVDPTMINNLAGKYRVGYGTPFDLDELCDSVGIDLDNITHVRLIDVVGTIDPEYATRDAFGHIVNDPYPTRDTVYASGGFDLTGVAVLFASVGIPSAETCREMSLRVWPNPTIEYINVTLGRSADAVLFDHSGRFVGRYKLNEGVNTIVLGDFPSGVYILRVGERNVKIVKM